MPPVQSGANPATITINPSPPQYQQPSSQNSKGKDVDVDLYGFDLSSSENMDEVYSKNHSLITIKIE